MHRCMKPIHRIFSMGEVKISSRRSSIACSMIGVIHKTHRAKGVKEGGREIERERERNHQASPERKRQTYRQAERERIVGEETE